MMLCIIHKADKFYGKMQSVLSIHTEFFYFPLAHDTGSYVQT